MDNYLLSIVIPTRNRQNYCLAAIEQILSLNLESTQIVIQDNSDNETLTEKLNNYILNNKVKYHYHSGLISFVDNFSEAISLCDGEYVCMIGDDDGILPNIINVTKSAKARNIDCVVTGLNAVYIWPSDKPIVKKAENGYLCLAYIQNKEVSLNPEKGLWQLTKTAGQRYQELDLPRVYHGIAKRSKFDEVKAIAGNYFMGLTPDIFIAVALASVCKKVIRIYYPVTISGICPDSGSSNSATGKHTGDLKDAPHFKGHDNYQWDSKAPAIYSVESIWAETALHAFHLFKREDLYNNFNVKHLDSLCLIKYPQFKNLILAHAKANDVKISKVRCKSFNKINKYFFKIYARMKYFPNVVKKFYNVADIKNAEKVINENLD